jgi:hypothetical protein
MSFNFLYFQVRAAIVGNYKEDRLFGRGEKYADDLIDRAFRDVQETGVLTISKFESMSGQPVTFRTNGDALIREE